MTDIPHFALPFRVENGAVAESEQDTNDEIADCVQAIVRYPLGYRIELPGFGVPEQEFQQGGADPIVIQAQIDTWEPRAGALTTAEIDALVATVHVTVTGGT